MSREPRVDVTGHDENGMKPRSQPNSRPRNTISSASGASTASTTTAVAASGSVAVSARIRRFANGHPDAAVCPGKAQ